MAIFDPLFGGTVLGTPAIAWIAFVAIVAALLVFDLGILGRRRARSGAEQAMSTRQSLWLSAFYIGSGLAFVPLAAAPVYSATKAAVHSFTVSLRHQLRGTNVRVIELIPPVVETDLHRGQTRRPPSAMPLDAFVTAAMRGLNEGRDEVAVGLAKVLRTGSRVAPGFLLGVVNRQRGQAAER